MEDFSLFLGNQEEDVIGIMTGGEVDQLQPLGDRILVKVLKSLHLIASCRIASLHSGVQI